MNTISIILAWLVGVAIGLAITGAHPRGIDPALGLVLLALSGVALVAAGLGREDVRLALCGCLAFALLAGCGRTLLTDQPVTAADLVSYNGDRNAPTVTIVGDSLTEPVTGDQYQTLRIKASTVRLASDSPPVQVSGDLLVLLPRYPAYDTGERLSLQGRLTAPPSSSGFDYASYLARHGVRSYMAFPRVRSMGAAPTSSWLRPIVQVRQWVRSAIERGLPEPQASLAVGVVTGDRTTIPESVADSFNRSGTTHILAISGENMSLLVGFVFLFFGAGRTRRRLPLPFLLAVLVLLVAYTAFTGATPSVVRAAIMSFVLLLAQPVGRRFDAVSALTIAAGAMTLQDPNVLVDGGFLLSYTSMLGLVQVSPFLYAALGKVHVPAALGVPLAATLGAQAATSPLILLLTGRISLVAPLASLATDFALLPLMIAGIAMGIAGAVLPVAGSLLGFLAWIPATWMLASVHWWGALPLASINLQNVGPGWVLAYYLALVALIWWGKEGRRKLSLSHSQLALAGTGIVVWCALVGAVLQ